MNSDYARQHYPSIILRWWYARNVVRVHLQRVAWEDKYYRGLPKPDHYARISENNAEANFVNRLIDELANLNISYTYKLRVYRVLRIVSLVAAASVPVMSVTNVSRWVIAAAGSIVVALEGILQLIRFQEQAVLELRLFGQLRRELDAYQNGSGIYRDNESAFADFVDAIAEIKNKTDEGLADILSKTSGPPRASETKQLNRTDRPHED
jgi:hypothetical protein